MLFRKKKTDSLPETTDKTSRSTSGNRRKYYRVSPGAGQRIVASVDRKSGEPIGGDCIDLSIGGAWVRIDPIYFPKLQMGEVCALRIRAESRAEGVRASCRVVAVQQLDKRWIRVGFEFTNRIELYAQLDEFYANLFNRRRHVRIQASYDFRVPVKLAWRGGSVPAIALDISEGGLGVTVPIARANVLERISEVEATFRLPRERADVVCSVKIRSRTNLDHDVLFGLEFTSDGGIEEHIAAVRRCIEKRLAAFQSWNAGRNDRARSKRAS